MIKIIKKGTRKTKECDSCGCSFSFEEEDIEVQDDWYEYKQFIRCPQCKNIITLGVNK